MKPKDQQPHLRAAMLKSAPFADAAALVEKRGTTLDSKSLAESMTNVYLFALAKDMQVYCESE
eukprot:6238204-Heterocapsa_arctica.AAC.1